MATSIRPYEVIESYDGVTYRLPRRRSWAYEAAGVVCLLFGLCPIAMGITFLGFLVTSARGMSAIFVLISFGMGIVPLGMVALGLAMLFVALYLLAGHDELVLDPRALRAVMRVGPLRWSRSVSRERLRRVTVVESNSDGSTSSPGLYSLRTEDDRGRKKTLLALYPAVLVRALAADLAVRCKTMPPETDDLADIPPKLVVDEDSDVPTKIRDRVERPASSTAILERTEGGLRITIPRVGFWRGSSAFAKFFVFFWCTITGILVTAFSYAILTGGKIDKGPGVPESNWFLVLFFTPFVLVGVIGLLALIQQGRRWAELTVSGDDLMVERWEWFRHRRWAWRREAIRNVLVEAEKRTSDDGEFWVHKLRIEPEEGDPLKLLSHREKAELEWIASTLRRGLFPPPA